MLSLFLLFFGWWWRWWFLARTDILLLTSPKDLHSFGVCHLFVVDLLILFATAHRGCKFLFGN